MTDQPRPDADDPAEQAEIDRIFAELVAGWHTGASPDRAVERPTPQVGVEAEPDAPGAAGTSGTAGSAGVSGVRPPGEAPAPPASIDWTPRPPVDWSDAHPLFAPQADAAESRRPVDDQREEPYERYRPAPQPPLQRPRWPVLTGWLALAYAVLATLLVTVGVPMPSWTGWTAVIAFLAGFGLLVSQLPRRRPPGDGAVL